MEKTTDIRLVQKPVIQHALVEVGANVTSRIEKLNVNGLIATGDTIQSLKTLRAELSKELAGYEGQRKDIKSAVANPYLEFEATYKTEVSEKYKGAISTLKDKIGEFENKVKQEKKDTIQSYFAELCLDADIDFLQFNNTKIEVNLSTSLKKYKEQCQEFVQKISDDVSLIKSTEHEAEIMTEYKTTLNASKAITTVKERKEAEKLEADRIKLAETQRRETMLRNIAMVFHHMTKTFNWVTDESIFIEQCDVENLSKEEFNKEFVALEARIKATMPVKAEVVTQSEPVISKTPTPVPAKSTPLKAPTVVHEPIKEKTFKASFECEGTMSQLKALGQYMKDNNITYKNI